MPTPSQRGDGKNKDKLDREFVSFFLGKKRKYDVDKGSATWQHKIREAHKSKGMKVPEKFSLANQGAKSEALKKKIM